MTKRGMTVSLFRYSIAMERLGVFLFIRLSVVKHVMFAKGSSLLHGATGRWSACGPAQGGAVGEPRPPGGAAGGGVAGPGCPCPRGGGSELGMRPRVAGAVPPPPRRASRTPRLCAHHVQGNAVKWNLPFEANSFYLLFSKALKGYNILLT